MIARSGSETAGSRVRSRSVFQVFSFVQQLTPAQDICTYIVVLRTQLIQMGIHHAVSRAYEGDTTT